MCGDVPLPPDKARQAGTPGRARAPRAVRLHKAQLLLTDSTWPPARYHQDPGLNPVTHKPRLVRHSRCSQGCESWVGSLQTVSFLCFPSYTEREGIQCGMQGTISTSRALFWGAAGDQDSALPPVVPLFQPVVPLFQHLGVGE